MKNPNMQMKDMRDYKFTKGFPFREVCDFNDPKEKFVWMFVALPGQNGAAMVWPTEYWMIISEHLDECGAMLKCESCGFEKPPVKKYRPPSGEDPNRYTGPGYWVPIDSPDVEPNPARQFVRGLPPHRVAEIKREIQALEGGDDAA